MQVDSPQDTAMPVPPPARFQPWVTRLLVGANVLVFVAVAASGGGWLHADAGRYIDLGSNFAPLTAAGEWWRLGSAMFLHFGLLHLAFNAWALWVIGNLVERLYGHSRYALIYGVAGLVGGLASMTWSPLANGAGASGAIFGVIGAQLVFFLRGGHRIPAAVVRAQRNSTLGFIAYALTFGFVVPGIDNAAHLGGLATGLALGWPLSHALGMPLTRASRGRGVVLAACLALVLVAGGVQAARWAAARHGAEQAYLLAWRGVVSGEAAVVDGLNGIMRDARDGRASDAQVVAWLDGTGIPFYRGAATALTRRPLPDGSPLAGARDEALQFVAGRAAAMELLADGIRQNDRDKLDRASRALSGGREGSQPGTD